MGYVLFGSARRTFGDLDDCSGHANCKYASLPEDAVFLPIVGHLKREYLFQASKKTKTLEVGKQPPKLRPLA
jgi:hypothetical protein